MDKLILVGNGFDLAHGLPTSYRSFIDFIWTKIWYNHQEFPFGGLVYINQGFNSFNDKNIETYSHFVKYVNDLKKYESHSYSGSISEKKVTTIYYKDRFGEKHTVFFFENRLFELITLASIDSWVDIENLYYQLLKEIVNREMDSSKAESLKKLHHEFKLIKDLLKFYLQTEIEDKIDFSNTNSSLIINEFEYIYKNLIRSPSDLYFLEFDSSKETKRTLVNFDERFQRNIRSNLINPTSRKDHIHQNLFLDFNYTSSVKSYVNILNSMDKAKFGKSHHIQIHGNLTDDNNQMNFGFGDEMDEHYKTLEKENDNKYLENIKSFMYSLNSNYKNLLNWIEQRDFQIIIMGHSCGLSDRTLLNTIFEHHNCKSIKIFYHKWNEGDNFRDLTQNISRHFNKKTLMREKVVDKSLCKPLPQNVRFQKKTTD